LIIEAPDAPPFEGAQVSHGPAAARLKVHAHDAS
jgi:hypothetical protein